MNLTQGRRWFQQPSRLVQTIVTAKRASPSCARITCLLCRDLTLERAQRAGTHSVLTKPSEAMLDSENPEFR